MGVGYYRQQLLTWGPDCNRDGIARATTTVWLMVMVLILNHR